MEVGSGAQNEPMLEDEESPTTGSYSQEKDKHLEMFHGWSGKEQVDFIESLISRTDHNQQAEINEVLSLLLQRDFISLFPKMGLEHIAENILSYLDVKSLRSAELVSKDWQKVIQDAMLWRKLIERKVLTDSVWSGLAERRKWIDQLFKPTACRNYGSHFYRDLYSLIVREIQEVENNWRTGTKEPRMIRCQSGVAKGVYCLQYDATKIVTGMRDNNIRIWDMMSLQCLNVISGHTGSVLCLQFDGRILVSGSSDSTLRVWDLVTGEMLNVVKHHSDAVLHLRLHFGTLVTCSKDRSIAVWDMKSPNDITLVWVLVGHRAAVNVVDLDDKYIVSASGDRTIKVWSATTSEFLRTLTGHRRGIACLHFKNPYIVTGSSDFSVRVWHVESEACIRVLEGHEDLVRCIRFDTKRIVSGSYDGKIKIWDMEGALDPHSPDELLCLRTLHKHTGRVFRLQFDDFKIVSSSHDDTILIWDFLSL